MLWPRIHSNPLRVTARMSVRWVLCAVAWFATHSAIAEEDIVSPASDLKSVHKTTEGNDETGDFAEEPLAPPPRKKAAHGSGNHAALAPSTGQTSAGKSRKDKAMAAKTGKSQKAAEGSEAEWDREGEGESDGEAEVSPDKPGGRAASGSHVAAISSDDAEPLAEKTTAQQVSGGMRVEDIVEPPSDYRYAAFGKHDPFVPPMVTERDAAAAAAADSLEIPIISPLQRFALKDLNVIGIWQLSNGEHKAMIMTPSSGGAGQGIIVKIGDSIGNRGGKIQAIGDDFMTVREFLLAQDGTRQFEDKLIFMGKRVPDEPSGKILFTPGSTDTKVILDTGQDDGSGVKVPGAKPGAGANPGGAPRAAAGAAVPGGGQPLFGGPGPAALPGDAPLRQGPALAPDDAGKRNPLRDDNQSAAAPAEAAAKAQPQAIASPPAAPGGGGANNGPTAPGGGANNGQAVPPASPINDPAPIKRNVY